MGGIAFSKHQSDVEDCNRYRSSHRSGPHATCLGGSPVCCMDQPLVSVPARILAIQATRAWADASLYMLPNSLKIHPKKQSVSVITVSLGPHSATPAWQGTYDMTVLRSSVSVDGKVLVGFINAPPAPDGTPPQRRARNHPRRFDPGPPPPCLWLGGGASGATG